MLLSKLILLAGLTHSATALLTFWLDPGVKHQCQYEHLAQDTQYEIAFLLLASIPDSHLLSQLMNCSGNTTEIWS